MKKLNIFASGAGHQFVRRARRANRPANQCSTNGINFRDPFWRTILRCDADLFAPLGGEAVVGGNEMSFISAAAAVLAAQIVTPSMPAPSMSPPLIKVQSCPDGYDADLRGRCYPTGTVPPQFQAARQGYQGIRRWIWRRLRGWLRSRRQRRPLSPEWNGPVSLSAGPSILPP
jgi:hypothetical protein